jgi:hypothetical protein
MKTFVLYLGIITWVVALFGGFGFLAKKTQLNENNTMSKDQVMLLLGWTWILMGTL